MTIGDAVEIMAKMDNAEREHLAYFIEVIGKSKKIIQFRTLNLYQGSFLFYHNKTARSSILC